MKNLNHTVQLDFSEGNNVTFNGLTYTFKQIHFYTLSEHLIDGMAFPEKSVNCYQHASQR